MRRCQANGRSVPFRPLPLLGNAHLQTILANALPERWTAPAELSAIALPDGDRLAVHDSRPKSWRAGGPIVLLIHGLGGSHRSSHVQRLVRLLLPRGVRAVCLDLRGAGKGLALARRPYHAGCSGDVRAVLAELHAWSPSSPLAVVGFSLGGNIALKLAGEACQTPVPGLTAVAAVAPPIDLEASARMIVLPRNRFYERYFLRSLVRQVKRRHQILPDLGPIRFPPGLRMREFDDSYIAPRWGFRDATDYYQQAASQPWIAKIALRTLILSARDDPFVSVAAIEGVPCSANVEVRIEECGGHLGFLGWDGGGGYRWAERHVANWICRHVS